MKPLSPIRTVALIAMLALLPAAGALAQSGQTIEVTITNLTPGQIISPPLVISHNPGFKLFEIGATASAGLAALAEDAETAILIGEIAGDPNVYDIEVAGGGIGPGQSITVEVGGWPRFRYVSVAGMLVTTNDTFFSVRGLGIEAAGTTSRMSPGYDAGSEANNEDCAFIPGPPCGSPGVGTATSEGFIHVGNGIHGIGSLDATLFDWRNPVASVTVRRAGAQN